MIKALLDMPYSLSAPLMLLHYRISLHRHVSFFDGNDMLCRGRLLQKEYEIRMKYLIGIFILVIIIGALANRELARDRNRIKRMMREYSYRTYAPEEEKNGES
jgi:hypothetical protein